MVIRALDRKLLRDLGRLRGQVITIALVVGAGIASWVTLRSAYTSLEEGRDAYYDRQRFADVFAGLESAPLSLVPRIEEIEGVESVYARLVERASLPVDFLDEPAIATIVSLPDEGEPPMNGVHLVSGRMPEPGHGDEVVLLEAFAAHHGLRPGDVLPAVLEGVRRDLRVVGIGMSPEYLFATSSGEIAAEGRFAALWMSRRTLAAAYQREGAFDDVVIRLQPGASEVAVIDALDRVLAPYGGRGAVGRSLQESSYALEGELAQLRSFATVAPTIFLAVAAFLLNVVLSRLVHLQRPDIATLKAVGYPDWRIALHYLELVAVMVLLGAAIGIGVGAWLGRAMVDLYAQFFRFPTGAYQLRADVVAVGVLVSLAAAVLGALATLRSVARLPPAEAMRPAAPATYRASWLTGTPLVRLFGTPGRMVMREIERRPLRLALSSAGIAMAIAIVVVGLFGRDALELLIEQQFQHAMREDVAVTFLRPLPLRAERDVAHLPGVLHAEGHRAVPARIHAGPRNRSAIVLGHADDDELRVLVDSGGREVRVPSGGLMLTSKLGEILGVGPGDDVTVELLEGDRSSRTVRISGLVDEPYGLWSHMREDELHALLREEPRVSFVAMRIDPALLPDLRARLRDVPQVVSVSRRQAMIDYFRDVSGRQSQATTLILTLFAIVIAVGVVYNNARVALAMRARDLASLRVLGFTRAEISTVLLGELAVQIFVAVPLGLAAGTWLARGVMATVDAERYRMTAVISPGTYAFAVTVALVAGLVSALLVRRRLDRLDLIGVLKTRE